MFQKRYAITLNIEYLNQFTFTPKALGVDKSVVVCGFHLAQSRARLEHQFAQDKIFEEFMDDWVSGGFDPNPENPQYLKCLEGVEAVSRYFAINVFANYDFSKGYAEFIVVDYFSDEGVLLIEELPRWMK